MTQLDHTGKHRPVKGRLSVAVILARNGSAIYPQETPRRRSGEQG